MEKVGGGDIDSNNATPARLSVFDAPLVTESITPQMRETLDDELTEVKSENAIDRITSQANPRTLERVPAGARFNVRMVLDVLCPEDAVLPDLLVQGLRLLEDDTLGGGGSRGSGRVRFGRSEADLARQGLLRHRSRRARNRLRRRRRRFAGKGAGERGRFASFE